MNYNRELWNIPASFYVIDTTLRRDLDVKLASKTDRYIECPKLFDGSEINQTKAFKQRFLNDTPKIAAAEANPEEIELDL